MFAHVFNTKFKFDSILSIVENKSENKSNLTMNTTEGSNELNQPFYYVLPFVIQFLSAIICYLGSSLAFKLGMNRFCFALPMTLTTPATLVAVLLICELKPLNSEILEQYKKHLLCFNGGYFTNFTGWCLLIGILVWWTSHLWTTGPIWLNYRYLSNSSTIKR